MPFKEAISPELLKLTVNLQSIDALESFRLVGGTSLAIQLGHRTSVDIDLFSEKSVDKIFLQSLLSSEFSDIRDVRSTSFGITCYIHSIKVDLCYDGGRFIRPPESTIGIRMASLEDIAAMKLGVISNRATQKDFFDIAVLTDKFSIAKMVQFYREKYPFMDVREPIDCLKKHYLADEKNPVLPLIPLTWKEATNKINNAYDVFISELKTSKQKQIEERLKKAEQLISKKKLKKGNDGRK